MKTVDNYGATFKEIREKRKLSLTQVARGITSPATLSRWENGKGKMYFDNVVSLLQRLDIYLDEFINIAQYSKKDNATIRVLLEQVQKAYSEDNAVCLEELAHKQMQRYHVTNKELDFFLAMTICSCYKDVTGENIFNDSEQARLSNIFQHVKIWNKYYIRAFGNCIALLDSDQLVEISTQILNGVKEIPQDNLMQISESMRAVLNAVIILIRRDIKLAQILINKIESSMIPVDLLYLKMRVLFLQELISYLQDDGHSVDVMEKLTCMLRLLGYDNEANGWGQLFKNSIQKDHEQ
ncbi:helix-turn-helix domain-containing protein [Lactobacillus ultunensis]|uniref:DNA-binding helix-turn-helix protein n=1 Tax=Lactobacillus ultunensis DSM 16047 TaxID=525365 RepID=C2EP92_9LACO|nr:Rgg/GadR/MutR family transcriptional regulator [Lactobacillus ultunensis]EEJ71635.1 DNA-binding helix-turn-helix protein [Lactobacillus ultunensis DSM 16047]KRL80271.1 transcriptional regulator [Lactobacillus ultunensis DSM 16047]QQP28426.1 helix-turn-helix domain-containing protein [Lactobacillus ultunensis]